MPSLFNSRPSDIESTACPPFDQQLSRLACQARLGALASTTVSQAELALRVRVGHEWASNLQDPAWEAQYGPQKLFPSPPALPEALEVTRLRGVLPAELLEPINGSGLSLVGQMDMAHALEANLLHYLKRLAAEGDPHALHKVRLEQAYVSAGVGGYPPKLKPDSLGQPVLGMIPTGAINTISTQRRYFRALAWNLENFTHDRRPRGSAPIDSVKNQARIAIVTEAMRAFDVDLLLVMETGYDVGPAMTAIATRLETRLGAQPYGVHPLVSPPTGALPYVRNEYTNKNLGRRTGTKVLALRTLFEVYHVSADDEDHPLTRAQVAAGWRLLRESSSPAKLVLIEPTDEEIAIVAKSGRCFPNPGVIGWLRWKLSNIRFLSEIRSELPDQLYTMATDLIEWTALLANEEAIDLTSTSLSDIYDDFCDGIQLLRELADEASDDIEDYATRVQVVGCAQGLELMLLFFLQSLADGIPQDGRGLVFQSCHAGGEKVTLAAYLAAASSSLHFDAIDQVLGPLDGEVDNDVVLDALQRLGFVDRHIETYGMVYRPPCENALTRLFQAGVLEHGYKDGSEEQAARYDIVRAPLSRGDFSIQEAGGLLNWRSALQVTVPVSDTLSLPLALFHTRYSGTAAIAETYTGQTKAQRAKKSKKSKKANKFQLTVAEAEVKARAETLILMARALLPGHSRFGMPLIIGDFNIPDEYLEPSADTGAPVVRKQDIRQALLTQMAASGYLRHTSSARPGEKHPLTTLKSFGSLALKEAPGSQPYDGLYEPFDFANRKVVVRSGVVKLTAIISPEAMGEQIRGAAVAPGEVVDLDATDSSDIQPEDDTKDDNQSAPPNLVTMQVLAAAGVEVARVYAACARRLVRRIGKMMPWIDNLDKSATRSQRRPYATHAPSALLRGLFVRLRTLGADTLPQQIAERETWFAERCANNEYVAYADFTKQADPFDAHVDLLKQILAEAQQCGLPNSSLDGLESELSDVRKQLHNLETDAQVRAAVAYRAVVSDHLPQIIEFDLEPGS